MVMMMTATNSPTPPTDVPSNASSAPTSPVPIVANECHRDETAVGDSVAMPAERPLTNNANGVTVTPTNTKRHPIQKPCDYCGTVFTAKRPQQAKYCSANCRRKAWLVANPDKAAVLAQRDKARLRAHIESRGGTWEVMSGED